jgi:hypothetical protein
LKSIFAGIAIINPKKNKKYKKIYKCMICNQAVKGKKLYEKNKSEGQISYLTETVEIKQMINFKNTQHAKV